MRASMPASRASTRAAAAEGATPSTGRAPASATTSRSMVVLPVPAKPCTATARWDAPAMSRTAARWPRVRRLSFKPRLERRGAGERRARVAHAAHPGHERALVGERAARNERPVPAAPGPRLKQVALAPAALERCLERAQVLAPRVEQQRGGEHVALAQHREALFELRHRGAHRLQGARAARPPRAPRAGTRAAPR